MRKKARNGNNGQGKRENKKARAKGGVRPAKVFIYALALAALGGGGYLVYDRLKRKKLLGQNAFPDGSDPAMINNSVTVSNSTTKSGSLPSNQNFPLKRGSKGTLVKSLQQALSKTTPSILIDGQFGPQTAGALKVAGYPETIDQNLFNKITGAGGGNLQVIFNPGTLAATLFKTAQAKNLSGVLSVLNQMKSVADYSSVNEYYKKQSFISKTIVTDLLEYSFKYDESAKAQIKNEFLRMGLKVNSSGTWSLQGIRLYKDLITIRETIVTDSKNNKIPVRGNTILGDEMEVGNGMTWFRSIDNSILKVPTQDVKYT